MAYDRAFHALHHFIRREILLLLQQGPKSVGEIRERLVRGGVSGIRQSISRSGVSQHLKVLLQAELVSCRPEGSRNLYRLRQAGIENLQDYLEYLLKVPVKD
jgi:DNA-binding transcriptional ArsR family regulator